MTPPVVVRVPGVVVVQDERSPRRPAIQPVAPYRRRLMTRRTTHVPQTTGASRRIMAPRHPQRPESAIPIVPITATAPSPIRIPPVIIHHDDIRPVANDDRVPTSPTSHQARHRQNIQRHLHCISPAWVHFHPMQGACNCLKSLPHKELNPVGVPCSGRPADLPGGQLAPARAAANVTRESHTPNEPDPHCSPGAGFSLEKPARTTIPEGGSGRILDGSKTALSRQSSDQESHVKASQSQGCRAVPR